MTLCTKRACGSCGGMAHAVKRITLLHQLQHPHPMMLSEGPFYFCAQTRCEVVYFSDAGLVYRQEHLRQPVDQKSTEPRRILCYCFGLSEAAVRQEWEETGQNTVQAFIMEQTRLKRCACEVCNPSGQCCLKDFPVMDK